MEPATLVADVYYCNATPAPDQVGARVTIQIHNTVTQDAVLESVIRRLITAHIPEIYQIVLTSAHPEDPRVQPIIGAYRFYQVVNDPAPETVYRNLRTLVRVLCHPIATPAQ